MKNLDFTVSRHQHSPIDISFDIYLYLLISVLNDSRETIYNSSAFEHNNGLAIVFSSRSKSKHQEKLQRYKVNMGGGQYEWKLPKRTET